MERRARRWRLPLAARIVAVPVLVAATGALAFGFSQSDAASSAAEKPRVEIVFTGGVNTGDNNSAPYGEQIDVQVTVIPSRAGDRPAGTVRFGLSDGSMGTDRLPLTDAPGDRGTTTGSVHLTGQSGIGWPYARTYTLTAIYDPTDARFTEAHNGIDFTVRKTTTEGRWEISTDPVTSTPGQTVQLKAKVSNWGNGYSPEGKVHFFHKVSGAWQEIASGNVWMMVATAKYTFQSVGVQEIQASYDGNGNYEPLGIGHLGSTWQHKVLVPSTTTLSSEANPATLGQQPLPFTVKVTADKKPAGTVVLNKLEDGKPAQKIADGPLGSDGTAKLTATLPVGTTKLQACFTSSDGVVAGSCSAEPLTQVVTKIPSTAVLSADRSTAHLGDKVTLNATLTGKPGTPAGKVTFLDGSAELGKGDLDKDGTATFGTSTLAAGTHTLTARFDGSDTFDASTSDKVTVQVNGAAGGGTTPQPKNLASTGASIGGPIGIGALLLILGAVAVRFGRRRLRVRRSR